MRNTKKSVCVAGTFPWGQAAWNSWPVASRSPGGHLLPAVSDSLQLPLLVTNTWMYSLDARIVFKVPYCLKYIFTEACCQWMNGTTGTHFSTSVVKMKNVMFLYTGQFCRTLEVCCFFAPQDQTRQIEQSNRFSQRLLLEMVFERVWTGS